MCGVWGTGLGTSCVLQGTFRKGSGFPKNCLHLPSLLPKGPIHHPRVLPKAFQWKVVSMFRSSRSSGAGPRNLTPSQSRSRSQYIGSPLNASYAVFLRFAVQFLCPKMCMHGGSTVPQGRGWGIVIWQPSLKGWRGTVFHGVGQDGGGGGTWARRAKFSPVRPQLSPLSPIYCPCVGDLREVRGDVAIPPTRWPPKTAGVR